MQISGRLSETTLGDVLGALFRARVTGLVRLTEGCGSLAVRSHGIYLSRGEVVAVDTSSRVASLGEILQKRGLLDAAAHRQLGRRLAASRDRKVGDLLVEECRISPDVVGAALRQQLRSKLDALFSVRDATLSFHVACALPENRTTPLAPREYLHGRPRARDRQPRMGRRKDETSRRNDKTSNGARMEALSMLGVDEDASIADVTRAFRELASQFHPDRHHGASESARRIVERRFAALSAAYHLLID